MKRFQSWLQKILTGRNGPDELARLYSITGCVVLVLSLLVPQGVWRSVLSVVGAAIIVLSYFRIFSRNVYKRRGENQHYVQWRSALQRRFRQWKLRCSQRKEHRFFRCEKCRTMTRVPRGRGKIEITCPKCGHHFIRRS